MHQDPEHNDYDDDDYNYYPQYNDYGYPYDKQHKFNPIDWEIWLIHTLGQLAKENKTNMKKDHKFIKLGVNNYGEEVWKMQYFINNKLDNEHKQHIMSNAAHFLSQPVYYKGLFENLN